jgi:hypothetical protein
VTVSEGAPSLLAEPRRWQALRTGKWRHRTAKQPERELPSTVETAPSQRNRISSSEKATHRTKGGDESPQDGVTVLADLDAPECPVPSEHRQTLIQRVTNSGGREKESDEM